MGQSQREPQVAHGAGLLGERQDTRHPGSGGNPWVRYPTQVAQTTGPLTWPGGQALSGVTKSELGGSRGAQGRSRNGESPA